MSSGRIVSRTRSALSQRRPSQRVRSSIGVISRASVSRLRGGHTSGVGQAELLIAALLVAVAGLSALARRLGIPYPIVLVIGGALFGFVPGLPELNLDPDVVLVVF